MKLKNLLDVLVADKVVVTYHDPVNDLVLVLKESVNNLKYKYEILDLEVQIMYVNKVDQMIHIITKHSMVAD